MGEASSLWDLLHIHDFFVLLLLQGEASAPLINGTCGTMYMYETVPTSKLFDKYNINIIDRFISKKYQWILPVWEKRVNIAVGLLEFVQALSELHNARFYVCEMEGTQFGHNVNFEAKLTMFDNVVSNYMIETSVKGRTCTRDSDCYSYSKCSTACDKDMNKCSKDVTITPLVGACHVLEDYILFDAPQDFKANLSSFINRCKRFKSRDSHKLSGEIQTKENLLLQDLIRLLWEKISSKPANWLSPPKKKKTKSG